MKKHEIANMRSLKMVYLWLNNAESSSQFQQDRARTWALRPMFVGCQQSGWSQTPVVEVTPLWRLEVET